MATLITKNSSTASSVPTAAQLVQGELAVNVTDKRLFTKNASGTVVELGTNPSSLTLTNGTANGVPYLNSSKVLTTGSALTFDGANLGIGTSSPNYRLQVQSAGTGTTAASNIVGRFQTNGSGYDVFVQLSDNVANSGGIGMVGGAMYLANGTTRNLTLDSSGNLGLGVTPSTNTAGKTLQLGNYAALSGTSTGTYLANNWSYNAGDKYINTAAASLYYQAGGAHVWLNAPSGTAGNAISFTQALTLDASGRLLVGLTSATSTNANIQTNKPINLAGYTVATLPSGTLGDMAYVTDALAPTFLGTIVGGGTIKTPVFYNGTNWVAY